MRVGRQNSRRISQHHVSADLCIDTSNYDAVLHKVSAIFNALDLVNHPLHRNLCQTSRVNFAEAGKTFDEKGGEEDQSEAWP